MLDILGVRASLAPHTGTLSLQLQLHTRNLNLNRGGDPLPHCNVPEGLQGAPAASSPRCPDSEGCLQAPQPSRQHSWKKSRKWKYFSFAHFLVGQPAEFYSFLYLEQARKGEVPYLITSVKISLQYPLSGPHRLQTRQELKISSEHEARASSELHSRGFYRHFHPEIPL